MKKGFLTQWPMTLSIGLVVGVGIGMSLSFFTQKDGTSPIADDLREFRTNFKFINPLLACGNDTFSKQTNQSAIDLETKIRKLISRQERTDGITNASVYFRSLKSGPLFGINADETFTPGSLLKVPLVMSVYTHAEKDTGFLSKTVLFEGGNAPAKEHYASEEIEPGKTYTVEDLIKAVLVHSDNNAALLLVQLITEDELNASYEKLGIQIPSLGKDYTMTVRTYASFFRILFNATYLNQEHSERVLSFLSETTFKDGLVSGMPSGTLVAHKFGERQYEGDTIKQLHDCGIIYKAEHPYLLCIMMRGNSFEALAKGIQDIAQLVYTYAE